MQPRDNREGRQAGGLSAIRETAFIKGVGTIIPNLLTADRSVICIDPKGEMERCRRRTIKSILDLE